MIRILCILLLLLFIALPATPLQAAPLSLRQAERMALERNLELRAATFVSRASDALVRKGFGIYDPRLEVLWTEGESRDLSNFQFFTGQTGVDNRRVDFSLAQTLPTGGELTASMTNRRDHVFAGDEPFLDPEYDSELKLSLVQPLLQGLGRTVTEQTILFAIKDREISVQNLRERGFEILARVRDVYFEVQRQREDLRFRETSVSLAQKVLEENRARLEAGVLAPVELLEAEVGLKQRERDLLDARRAYQDALDELAVLLNEPGPLETAEEPLGVPSLETDEDLGMLQALEKRPDLQRRARQIQRLSLERRIARNRALPRVDLLASYSHKGVGEDYSEDLDRLAEDEIRNWEVGLTLSYPLGNRDARQDYRRTELQLAGLRAGQEQLRREARSEVRTAIRLLDVSRTKIEVAHRAVELAEEKLRILLRRKEVGLATTRQVLEGEEDLAEARTDHTAALTEYNRAVTRYLQVTGLLLEREGIRLAGPADSEGAGPLLEMYRP